MKNVISVEHLSKQYDLGVIGTGTLSRDLNRWWARVRKQPDPYTRIGQRDAFERIGESILALDDVSFQVQQGEALGIIGRNGAGKSTLLKILSRVTAPTSGVVKVRGRIGSLLEVGTGFHPELTGRENVYLNGAILGMRKEEVTRKFDEIVDFAGVEKFIDTPVKRYSSGMYVRLAFAVAAHLDPEILIVDEVLAVGDAEFQKKCLGKMGDVAGEGRTVLFVSHNMAAIQNLCPKSMLLYDGQLIRAGETMDVINQYLQSTKLPDGKKNLRYITDRKGSQILKFVDVGIYDRFGTPVDTVRTGQDIIFRLYYEKHSEVQVKNVHISILVSHQGTTLININNEDIGIEFTDLFADGYFECKIPNINLTGRTYDCSIFCAINHEICDYIENAFQIDVIDGDFYKVGKKIQRQSKFLIPYSWETGKNNKSDERSDPSNPVPHLYAAE